MNIRQLSYFCSAAKTGSFSRAAQEAGVSVQAVSKALGELEAELGQTLFVRGSTGSPLTPFGRAFLSYASSALTSFERAERFAHDTAQAPQAHHAESALTLVIGAPPFGSRDRLRMALGHYFTQQLGFPVLFDVRVDAEAYLGLSAGAYNAYIRLGDFEDDACDIKQVGTVSTAAFFSATHPLARRPKVTIAELSRYPLISSPAIADFNAAVAAPYRAHGLTSPEVTLNEGEGFTTAVLASNGYSIGIGIEAFGTPGIAELHVIEPTEMLPVTIYRVALKGATSPRLARFDAFMDSHSFNMQRMLGGRGI